MGDSTKFKKFNALATSSKIAICGLPLRVDSYKFCSFGCKYCFSNNRKIGEVSRYLQIANVQNFKNTLKRVHEDSNINKESLIDNLLAEDITLHWGGCSDPFQPVEGVLGITQQLVDISNKYNKSILFSTKSANLYNVDIRPDLHSFQFSFSSSKDNPELEPNVPKFKDRLALYKELKAKGFKVGIRVQPFIPNYTDTELVDIFKDADYFTIEGLKIVPQNEDQKQFVFDKLNIPKSHFKGKGLIQLREDIRIGLYKDFISRLNFYGIPFSIADNDMRKISSSKCCCGQPLIKKSTDFNTTAMLYNYGSDYSLQDTLKNCSCNLLNSKAEHLFTSNRRNGCYTLEDFYKERFDKKNNPFSPQYQIIK